MASPPMHEIWGEAEVLSCYSSSDAPSRGPRTGPRRFPRSVKWHIENNVKFGGDRPHSSGPERQLGSPLVPGSPVVMDNPMVTEDPVVIDLSKPPVWTGRSSLSADAVQPSLGSERHASRNCKPCLYVGTRTGCLNGASCTFCHYPHSKRARPRPSKATRIQCKQLASMLDASAPDSQRDLGAAEQLEMDKPYMRLVLAGRRREREAAAASSSGGGIKDTAAEEPTGAPAKVPTHLQDPGWEQ